jgi:hypothetical protein
VPRLFPEQRRSTRSGVPPSGQWSFPGRRERRMPYAAREDGFRSGNNRRSSPSRRCRNSHWATSSLSLPYGSTQSAKIFRCRPASLFSAAAHSSLPPPFQKKHSHPAERSASRTGVAPGKRGINTGASFSLRNCGVCLSGRAQLRPFRYALRRQVRHRLNVRVRLTPPFLFPKKLVNCFHE